MKPKIFFTVLSILSFEIISAQNPMLIDDYYVGSFGSYPTNLVVFNNKLYFSARDYIHGMELIEYDGTNEPILYDLSNMENGSFPNSLCVYNNKLYFNARDQQHGNELWSFDGMNQPTMEYDIREGASGSNPGQLMIFNNKLHFVATDNMHGRELWSFDGVNPPEMVYDINEGSGSSGIEYLTTLNNKLYFKANNGVAEEQIWEYDGTNFPVSVSNIPGLDAQNLCAFNDKIYFCGTSEEGSELWTYDGTVQPYLVADIYPGSTTYFDPSSGNYYQMPNSAYPHSLFVYLDKLYFCALDGIHGNELWSIDESSNPSLVIDLNPGSQGSNPREFSIYKTNLYFSASDGMHPGMLWSFNGIQDPVMAGDTGNLAYYPLELTTFNNKLYFSADDYSTFGRELWAYDDLLTDVSTPMVEKEITIFPIPTKDELYIVLSGSDSRNILLEMCNIQGQTIEFLPFDAVNLNSIRADISKYPSGIYLVKIYNENFIKVGKIVKN